QVRADVVVRNDDGDQNVADRRAPRLTDMTPGNGEQVGERGRVRLTARVSDEGSGIDPNSLRLFINGQNVTSQARLRGDQVRYRDNLAPGRHTAELVVRDKAGNTSRQAWSFRVVDADRYGGVLPLEVTSHADNAVVDADG